MDYFADFNSIIIYGGKNEFSQNMIFNDIHILNLENLTWTSLNSFGVPVPKVCGHTTASIDGKMLIFGGI
jgi:N-acetylneuraminic acid mutarotase